MNGDVIIYEAPGGRDYIMRVAEAMNGWPEGWWRWPAEAAGWAQRKRMPEPGTDVLLSWHELPSKNSQLALRLSGVE
jgi:hypothetical protein